MKYKVIKELTLGVGNEVILTPRQAQARNLCLSCVGEDKYMVLRNCVFKRGEIIEFDEVPEKRMIEDCLEPASDEPASDEPASDEPASDEPASDEPDTVVKRRYRRKNV